MSHVPHDLVGGSASAAAGDVVALEFVDGLADFLPQNVLDLHVGTQELCPHSAHHC